MTRALRTWLVVAGFALTAAVTAAPSAAASTSAYFVAVPALGHVNCYNYVGTFKQGSHVMVVDWIHGSDECFGIAPNRTIWHAWPGSGGWQKMAGSGLADDIFLPVQEHADGTRGVTVRVTANNSVWIQLYYPSTGWTGIWGRLNT
jgi:hypothetical protein